MHRHDRARSDRWGSELFSSSVRVQVPLAAVFVSLCATVFGLLQIFLFVICSLDFHDALGSLM